MQFLKEAIEQSNIIPKQQKRVLQVICSYSYSIPAKQIEDELTLSKPSVSFALQELVKRNFVCRKKDGVYLYESNKERIVELLERYKK